MSLPKDAHDLAEKGEAGPAEAIETPIKSPTTSSSLTLQGPESDCTPRGRRLLLSILSWLRGKKIPVIVRKLEDHPKGYPLLAAFVDSADNYMMYRRFGWLQARLLLDKQAELRKLERQLEKFDKRMKSSDPAWLMTSDLPPEQGQQKRELFTLIEQKLQEYSSLLIASQQLKGFKGPADSEYSSVVNFMENHHPLGEPEDTWIYNKEDMLTLRSGREHAFLDTGIEHLLRWTHCSFIEWLFCSKETRLKSQGIEVYYTRGRIERLVDLIILAMILTLLIVPIYILWHLINDVGSERAYTICIGVLLVCTLLFSAVLSLFTSAKRHEVLAAAAAYCAVLVVFFGNVRPN